MVLSEKNSVLEQNVLTLEHELRNLDAFGSRTAEGHLVEINGSLDVEDQNKDMFLSHQRIDLNIEEMRRCMQELHDLGMQLQETKATVKELQKSWMENRDRLTGKLVYSVVPTGTVKLRQS